MSVFKHLSALLIEQLNYRQHAYKYRLQKYNNKDYLSGSKYRFFFQTKVSYFLEFDALFYLIKIALKVLRIYVTTDFHTGFPIIVVILRS